MPAPTVYQPLTRTSGSHANAFDNAPVVSALQTGGFDIGWTFVFTSTDIDARIQRFGADAAPTSAPSGQIYPTGPADDFERHPSMASNGTIQAVVFLDQTTAPNSNPNIQLSLYSLSTFTNGLSRTSVSIPIETDSMYSYEPTVVALESGAFAVAWSDTSNVYASVYDPGAGVLRNTVTVSTGGSGVSTPQQGVGQLQRLGMTSLSGGNYAVSWVDDSQHIHFRVMSPTGGISGDIDIGAASDNSEFFTSIVELADGRISLTYMTSDQSGATDYDVFVRFYNPDGTGGSSPFQVNVNSSNDFARFPDSTALLDGRLMVAWADGSNFVGRILNADGSYDSDVFTIAPQGYDPALSLATLADGRVVATFGQNENIPGWNGQQDIYTVILDPRVSAVHLAGTDQADQFIGSDFADTFLMGRGNDSVVGGLGADTIDGGQGADTMAGGNGDDVYYVDNAADQITEYLEVGVDQVFASASFSLATSFAENLSLTGSAAINATGNALENVLVGNGAANALDGGQGADTMRGGAGGDIYHVDNAGDRVVEGNVAGVDTVFSSVTFSLAGQYVENLTLTGAANINAVGNALVNVLTGNTGNNQLNGGAGADVMAGDFGDDTYIVDDGGDQITEAAGAGTDTVRSSITYALGANVENLVLTGAANINGVGNALANNLAGNAGNNQLNGGAGADSMAGGSGDDTYLVDNNGDLVTEAAGAGTDTVRSSVTYTLNANVENLVLTGSGNIGGVGNALANQLTGNSGSNQLNGGAGADTMTGGGGADYFLFGSALGGGNIDRITDFSHADDTIRLNDSVFTGLSVGTLAAGAFYKAAGAVAANDASDRIIYNTTTGALFFDRDGTGGTYAAVQFATLLLHPANVDSSDFVIV